MRIGRHLMCACFLGFVGLTGACASMQRVWTASSSESPPEWPPDATALARVAPRPDCLSGGATEEECARGCRVDIAREGSATAVFHTRDGRHASKAPRSPRSMRRCPSPMARWCTPPKLTWRCSATARPSRSRRHSPPGAGHAAGRRIDARTPVREIFPGAGAWIRVSQASGAARARATRAPGSERKGWWATLSCGRSLGPVRGRDRRAAAPASRGSGGPHHHVARLPENHLRMTALAPARFAPRGGRGSPRRYRMNCINSPYHAR